MTPTPPPQMTPSYAKASEATPEEEARAIVAPFRIDAAIVYPPDYEPLGGDAKELVAAIAAALRARAAPPASAEVQGVVGVLKAQEAYARKWAHDYTSADEFSEAAALLLRLDARVKEVEAELFDLRMIARAHTGCEEALGEAEDRATALEAQLRRAEEEVRGTVYAVARGGAVGIAVAETIEVRPLVALLELWLEPYGELSATDIADRWSTGVAVLVRDTRVALLAYTAKEGDG